MLAELEYAAAMLLCGFFLFFCYHVLLFFRVLFPHGKAVVDAEDILFFIAAGFLFFYIVYIKNDGILRWYAFAGCGLGCFIYYRTVFFLTEPGRKWLLQKCRKTVKIKRKGRQEMSLYQENEKGQVSDSERSSQPQEKKKKKKRT